MRLATDCETTETSAPESMNHGTTKPLTAMLALRLPSLLAISGTVVAPIARTGGKPCNALAIAISSSASPFGATVASARQARRSASYQPRTP